jgi:hypothetical protein
MNTDIIKHKHWTHNCSGRVIAKGDDEGTEGYGDIFNDVISAALFI